MATDSKKADIFLRIADRIRNLLFLIFRPNHSDERRAQDERRTQKYKINLPAVDIPQTSPEDEILLDASESRVEEATATGGRTEEVSISGPDPLACLPELRMNDQIICDTSEESERGPILSCASFQSLGAQNHLDEYPTEFYLLGRLPFELRLQIWQFMIEPRLVHYNVHGARLSHLNINCGIPAIMTVCHESRCEGLRIFENNENATLPRFFNPRSDILLWTRYPNCPNTIGEDVAKLLNSSTLRTVRNFAIVSHYWNKLLSDEGPNVGYTAIRKAPRLEVLTLVDDYAVRRHGARGLVHNPCGMEMKLIEIPPEDLNVRIKKWRRKKEVLREEVWERWDVHLTDSEGLPRRVPEIRFAKAILEKP